ncbi:hypothetical protein [Amycolatopsis alkalitolerans]|uniref:Uncharacterized protein n=1 Tax=Amycolatopsis alkalitolerans TaxID=2547244 RepID=A0A5C4LZZ4_9PSEU|nr:hypothetical protein [Amycolatopsis alkalitolerans]TNC23931.1 hypothetical protein FG385_19740 [Amycolatopsis alkalitolerans]
MSDTRLYYEQLRGRARQLVNRIDDAMDGLLSVDGAIDEVMRADMDNPGEMSTTDAEDIRRMLDTARFSLRAAERIAVTHAGDVDGAMRRGGLVVEKTAG